MRLNEPPVTPEERIVILTNAVMRIRKHRDKYMNKATEMEKRWRHEKEKSDKLRKELHDLKEHVSKFF